MQNKVLTIVVPTYNAEDYLEDNLKSLCVNEILDYLEVIIINDGSTDNSKEIAEKYVGYYPDTFKIITKLNGGHGSGINYGIKYATGFYFKVIDADDWVDSLALKRLVDYLRNNSDDIVYSGFLWAIDDGKKNINNFRKKAERLIPFKDVQYKKTYLFDQIANDLYIKIHNMTIKTSILKKNHIFIDENCYYVDTEFITFPIPYIKTISFINEFVYMYRIGRADQSVSIEKMQKNEINYNNVLNSIFKFYDNLGKDISCSYEKKNYIAKITARAIAGKIKILLSYPISRNKKNQLKEFDTYIKMNYNEIYISNCNIAIRLLRVTKYHLYYILCMLLKLKFFIEGYSKKLRLIKY